MNARRSDLGIETLRGVAILLLVTYHSVEGEFGAGEGAAEQLRHFNFLTENIRMPLFTVISGYLYAARPLAGPAAPFLGGKARRLLIPWVTVSTLTFVSRVLFARDETAPVWGDLWRIFVYPFEQFWFLPALMWLFVAMVLLERLRLLDTPAKLVAVVVVLGLLRIALHPVETLNISGASYLAVFFLVGCGMARFSGDQIPQLGVVAAVVVLIGLVLQEAEYQDVISLGTGRDSAVGTIVGAAAGVALLSLRRGWGPLAQLGSYSFAIYLFHIFGIGVAARIGHALDTPEALIFVAKIVLGLLAGIVAQLVLQRYRITALAGLGLRTAARRASVG